MPFPLKPTRLLRSTLLLLTAAVASALVGCSPSAPIIGQASLTGPLTFSTLTSSPATAQTATLSNTGQKPIQISSVSISGASPAAFSQTSTCSGSLTPGATCTVSVIFASATPGTFTGILVVNDDLGAQTAALSGTATATPVVTLSASTVNFPTLTAGATSPAQTVTLTNTGTAALSLTSVALSGTGANLFAESTTCGATVAISASCTFTTSFAPKVSGPYTAAIMLTDNAPGSPQTVALTAAATPATITIDTSNPSDWKIANGAISLDWNSLKANIFGLYLTGFPDNLVDTTNTSGGLPKGLYMDNTGFGPSTGTATYTLANGYLDWSITYPSNANNAFTFSEHFIVTPNDPGIHLYFSANHSVTDIAGGIGQVQYVFRDNLVQFPNTYAVDPSINSPGPYTTFLPTTPEMFTTAPGRAVQDATVDLHGFTDIPPSYTRGFYTKYDFAGYEYLHKAHGLFGSTYGVWTVMPSTETLLGGPTKQNLDFTGNLLMVEASSNHELNGLSLPSPAGVATSRLFGPFYVHLNTFGTAYTATGQTLKTPADMYADAVAAGASFHTFYDTEAQLVSAGYVPYTARGAVTAQINGVAPAGLTPIMPKTAWAVLSDPGKNYQYSSAGYQYWTDISANGTASFTGVVPGTYRLSVYVLGRWGELRQDGILVRANQTTTVPTQDFVAENFSTSPPVFTIGTADRSGHEFLHGHTTSGTSSPDDREFTGAWNYWADFASTNGAVVYNATPGPAGPATNDLSKWNYNHWGVFNPGLFAGVFNPADLTTDGYTYAIPSYVASLPGSSGKNGVTTHTPPWQVHFATPASQTGSTAQAYAVLSVSLACTEASYTASLNGQPLTWHSINNSDCMVRSGLSGYSQWIAFQWDASALNPPGQDNLITLSVSQSNGDMEDALRLELTNTSADPATRLWNDYEYLYKSTDIKANDAIPNP